MWTALTLAQDTGGEGPTLPLSDLGQLGAVGTILSIFFWFAWQVYKRERDRADANEAEIKRLNEVIQEKTTQALQTSSQALLEANRTMERVVDSPRRRSS